MPLRGGILGSGGLPVTLCRVEALPSCSCCCQLCTWPLLVSDTIVSSSRPHCELLGGFKGMCTKSTGWLSSGLCLNSFGDSLTCEGSCCCCFFLRRNENLSPWVNLEKRLLEVGCFSSVLATAAACGLSSLAGGILLIGDAFGSYRLSCWDEYRMRCARLVGGSLRIGKLSGRAVADAGSLIASLGVSSRQDEFATAQGFRLTVLLKAGSGSRVVLASVL